MQALRLVNLSGYKNIKKNLRVKTLLVRKTSNPWGYDKLQGAR
jgi:hypothetical protein